ncbi:MAG: hypothetical protein GF317_02520 [Candidatus Lokiarchaeota archaeon]|nr:hypothetical protein [Candidatus Lokiarchaeota archaeon]MBD3198781.1 hypothetical protein [Candidatus Lokiarchaeota archaeon]
MKLRLVLKTVTENGKEVSIKFNIAPSKHIGFINFINLAMNQDKPISISFEKISKTREKEESKIEGQFKFEAKNKEELKKLKEQIEEKKQKK